MPSIDTNVLLRWLLGDLPEQAARADVLVASGEQLVVDDVALIEVVFVLERVLRLTRASVVEAVLTVLSAAVFDLDRDRWRAVTDEYLAHPKLSVADIYLARRARERDATPLYTFDAKLAAQLDAARLVGGEDPT